MSDLIATVVNVEAKPSRIFGMRPRSVLAARGLVIAIFLEMLLPNVADSWHAAYSPEIMNFRVILWSRVSALAGFLFGFDSVVIFVAEKTFRSFGSSTHWVFAVLFTTILPNVVTAFHPGYVFLFFCLMMVLHLVWVYVMVPETKGRSLEEIQQDLGTL